MDQSFMSSSNNTFGLNLFKIARNGLKGKNVFLAPLSISAALSMTQLGAREKTALEIAQVLGWNVEDGEKIHKMFQAYLTSLQQPSEQYELSTANRIYLEQTFTVKEEFKSQTKEWYLAEPVHANFIQNADQEASRINNWVEEQTHNKIKDLFGPGIITPATRMVLVNAVYFKGEWDKQFEKNLTSPSTFKLAPGQTKEVPMMANKSDYGLYNDNDLNFTALELLYKGQDLAMIIILPNGDYGLEELVQNFTSDTLNTVIDSMVDNKEKIQLFMPKFEITSSFLLKQPLSSLGMPDAFDNSRADFTGMTGQRDLVLSEVVHKAFVNVNEEGTEAAAATGAVMMMRCCLPPPVPVVRLDHPFLFAIIDKRASSSVLFLGQVDDPST